MGIASERNIIYKSFNEYRAGLHDFSSYALLLFQYQYSYNAIYRAYVDLLKVEVAQVTSIEDIPFLPISFYKSHQVLCEDLIPERMFESSTTTGQIPSKHFVTSTKHYLENAVEIFTSTIGKIAKHCIIGLLPSYLERSNSSLVCMVDHFISTSQDDRSNFYLRDFEKLLADLESIRLSKQKVILFGVRYALLELAEQHEANLEHVIIIETGGMKGKRGPVTNEVFCETISQSLNPKKIISEYGMTELLSQAYSDEGFVFSDHATLKTFVTEVNDPFEYLPADRSGQLNVIDLANIDTCAFIRTDDLGVKVDNDAFKILGRLDHSEQRGCNLLVSDVIT